MATRSAQDAGLGTGISLRRRTLLEALLGSAAFSGVAFGALSALLDFLPRSANAQPDLLPSWRDGAAKRAIVSFVSDVSNPRGPRFVPPDARIASFDNDGTLWCERPTVEAAYIAQKAKALVSKQPELRDRPAYAALLSGRPEELARLQPMQVLQLLADTHTGMTGEEFADDVQRFLSSARHPRFGVPFFQLAYLPQLELISYLQSKGFSVWLCTRGELAFARAIAGPAYRIPPERVIGSYFHTGRCPIFAVGNERSGSDIAMLRYVRDGALPSLALLLDHDDAQREYAYDEPDNASRQAAARYGFPVISMKNDWGQIFTFQT